MAEHTRANVNGVTLAPCPFCKCEVVVERFIYRSGESHWRINGKHHDNCIYATVAAAPESHHKQYLINCWNFRG